MIERSLRLEWVKKSYGYPVRYQSEPDIPYVLYGSSVPQTDSCGAAREVPFSQADMSISIVAAMRGLA